MAEAAEALTERFDCVVLFEVTRARPNFMRPWQMHRQAHSKGSGFVIDVARRRIMTNHHVVANATDVRCRKHGSSKRWRARVLVQGHDCDLALVTVDDAEFWEQQGGGDGDGGTAAAGAAGGAIPAAVLCAELPALQASVNVIGYPTGGQTICVTEGVVSRIDCKNYRIGYTAQANAGQMLVIQVDSAINPGNSGGPAFDGRGRVVGVAFQGLSSVSTDNIGYLIPASIVHKFLATVDHPPARPDMGRAFPHPYPHPYQPAHASRRDRSSDSSSDNSNSSSSSSSDGATATATATATAAPSHSSSVIPTAASSPPHAAPMEYVPIQDIPFHWVMLENKSHRDFLRMDASMTGIKVTDVSPLAAAAAARAAAEAKAGAAAVGAGEEGAPAVAAATTTTAVFLQTDDVLLRLDGHAIGNDGSVRLRGAELVALDFLVTHKPRGEPSVFEVLRAGARRTVAFVLHPLPPLFPRACGFDCEPSYAMVGGLVFAPVTCPLLEEESRSKHFSGSLWNKLHEDMRGYRQAAGRVEAAAAAGGGVGVAAGGSEPPGGGTAGGGSGSALSPALSAPSPSVASAKKGEGAAADDDDDDDDDDLSCLPPLLAGRQETIVLLDVLRCDLNYGYAMGGWRWLRRLNGREVLNLAHLLVLYRAALRRAEDAAAVARRPADAFLIFEFENPPSTTSKIILRASACKSSEAPLLLTHRIPAVASAAVLGEVGELEATLTARARRTEAAAERATPAPKRQRHK